MFLAILILIFSVIFFWGYLSSSIMLKVPRVVNEFNPKSFGCNYESFTTFTEDQIKIEGWFVQAKEKSSTLLFVLHGWGANRSDVLATTIFLAKKYNLVYFDFRNHGSSGGDKTSLTCLEIKDFKAVVNFIEKEKKEFVQKSGVFGFSMGGSVAISAGAELPQMQAIVAESPFASYEETVYRFAKLFYRAPRFVVPLTLYFIQARLGFNPEKCSPIHFVSKISPRALLIIQGGNDLRMPVKEGQALYDRAREPKELWIVPETDHGAIFEKNPKEYQKKILDFFDKAFKIF
ncbi:MAG: alpha/beta hydrolase [Elusimicrobia bacterium]|nr:alpha/beta hydrolase [Elusimicrobiota bacterium]